MGADLVGRSDRGRRGGPRGEVALDGAGDFEEEEEADGDKVLEEDREGGEGGHAPHPGVRDQGPVARIGGTITIGDRGRFDFLSRGRKHIRPKK